MVVSKASLLYARPADRRQGSLSVSEQKLLSLLDRRRRKYLARTESDRKTGSCDKRNQPVHALYTRPEMNQKLSQSSATGSVLTSEGAPSRRRTSKNPRSRDTQSLDAHSLAAFVSCYPLLHTEQGHSSQLDQEKCCEKESNVLNRLGKVKLSCMW